MQTNEIRKKYLEFFKKKGHEEIKPAPLVLQDDPTTLFTSSGMQQLVPYLKGERHSMGTRLVDSQPSFRANDIEEVGDNRHTTFFEMLGNWSLGDYFKKEQLPWFYEFLTEVVGLDSSKLYATVYRGEGKIEKDKESVKIWQELFETTQPAIEGKKGFDQKVKIYSYTDNWWSRAGLPASMPPGEIGGPDSEVFFDYGPELKIHENSKFKNKPCHLNCDCGRFLEIGNSVFMQYEKQKDGSFKPLPKKNVDFGGGLERIAAAANNDPDVFNIDIFVSAKKVLKSGGVEENQQNRKNIRVILDHLRAALFITYTEVTPSNKQHGYLLRRLIRKASLHARVANIDLTQNSGRIIRSFIDSYKNLDQFENLRQKQGEIISTIEKEISKFDILIEKGYKLLKLTPNIKPFDFYQTYGIPFDLSKEIYKQALGIELSENEKKEYENNLEKHQQLSRNSSAGMFKGGLADQEEATTKLHTATHLLHKALRIVLGDHVRQEGSNITAERLRFDFSHSQQLTEAEKQKVEELINQKIRENLPVNKTIESKEEALKSGALAFFKETYPKRVSVYTVGKDPEKDWFSKEFCGGPHIQSTGEIGKIKITKEKSVGSGIRRIYLELVG